MPIVLYALIEVKDNWHSSLLSIVTLTTPTALRVNLIKKILGRAIVQPFGRAPPSCVSP